jgi:hypothetical protein
MWRRLGLVALQAEQHTPTNIISVNAMSVQLRFLRRPSTQAANLVGKFGGYSPDEVPLECAVPTMKNERSVMFEKSEMVAELHARLKEAGLNPLDPNVQAINAVVRILRREDRKGASAGPGGAEPVVP